jgi:hypothetical protein
LVARSFGIPVTDASLERTIATVAASSASELDAAVDELMDQLDASGAAVPVQALQPLLRAVAGEVSPVTRRDVAHLLADVAARATTSLEEVVDELVAQYARARHDAFLGPELLHAIAKLAARSPLARAALQSAILRLDDQDSRFLLIRAAKIVGWFAAKGVDLGANDRLEEWVRSPDASVQSEARVQRAVVGLVATLGADELDTLEARLQESHRALAAADASEELRTDATRLLTLVELLQSYVSIRHSEPDKDADVIRALAVRAFRLMDLVVDPKLSSWPGYAEGSEAVVEHRLFLTALAFSRLSETLAGADEWTDLDRALVEAVAALRLLVFRAAGTADPIDAPSVPLSAISENIGGKPLGRFLARAVGRARLARIVANWEARELVGEGGGTAEQLRMLYDAVVSTEQSGAEPALPSGLDVERLLRLAVEQPAAVAVLCQAMPGLPARLREAGLKVEEGGVGLSALQIPTEDPGLYGGDPGVDETVRPLLFDLWARLAPRFPMERWNRLKEVTVFLTQLARDLRSDLPRFMLAEEDGGLGQKAGEAHLQEFVFDQLRWKYGRAAVYEARAISGGRADSGLQFETFTIPIEVKAEYADVSRDHVRDNYVGQSHRYATDRDGIAVLLVLDVRSANAASQQTRRAGGITGSAAALYGLRDSFWVDAPISDSQVSVSHPSAVIVGLFPGNLPKPSSLTRYSRRPKRGRRG